MSDIFEIVPPSFPVKLMVVASDLFAKFIALITFSEFPLPLIPITTSRLSIKFLNCSTKIESKDTSFDQANTTGMLSEREIALNLFLCCVVSQIQC